MWLSTRIVYGLKRLMKFISKVGISIWLTTLKAELAWYWKKILELRIDFEVGFSYGKWLGDADGIHIIARRYNWLLG